MEYEDVLQSIGEFGLYQKSILLVLAVYPLFQGLHTNGWNFFGGHHEHFCYVPELANFSSDVQRYISIPFTEGSTDQYESCNMFDLQYDNFTCLDFAMWNRTVVSESAGVKECNHWTFITSTFYSTITSEVCCLIRWSNTGLSAIGEMTECR